MIAVLTRPRSPDESHLVAAEHREQRLHDLFGQLSVAQALTLSRRLDADRDGDGVALAFRRLTVERRRRLRAYLADMRRRIAISRFSEPGGRNKSDLR